MWKRIDGELRNAQRFGNPLREALYRLTEGHAVLRGSSFMDVSGNPTEIRKSSNLAPWWKRVFRRQMFGYIGKVTPPKYQSSTPKPNAGILCLLKRVDESQSRTDKASIVVWKDRSNV